MTHFQYVNTSFTYSFKFVQLCKNNIIGKFSAKANTFLDRVERLYKYAQ